MSLTVRRIKVIIVLTLLFIMACLGVNIFAALLIPIILILQQQVWFTSFELVEGMIDSLILLGAACGLGFPLFFVAERVARWLTDKIIPE